MQPYFLTYIPVTAKDIVGQEQQVQAILHFITHFKQQKKKALILYGPSGSGKTAALYAIARDLDAELLEMNASDARNKEEINNVLGQASVQTSLFAKQKILLADEIDGLAGREDFGGIQALATVIEKTRYPIICTANNPFDKKFAPLRSVAELIEFSPLPYTDITTILKRICTKERIPFEEDALKSLARRAGGDARAAINDLQLLTSDTKRLEKKDLALLADREKSESIINALVKVFKTTDPKIALDAFDSVDEELGKVMLWVDENLPKEYKKPQDLAAAYQYLAKADIFNRRIRRWQYWRFLVYISAFLTAGIAVSKQEKYPGFTQYTPTTRILKLWQANQRYLKRKSIAAKLAVKLHCSTTRIIQDTLPYLKEIFKKNKTVAGSIAAFAELDQEEVEWMRQW